MLLDYLLIRRSRGSQLYGYSEYYAICIRPCVKNHCRLYATVAVAISELLVQLRNTGVTGYVFKSRFLMYLGNIRSSPTS